MKLFVQLLEARNLRPNSDRPCQAYAQLKLGNTKQKSSVSPSGAEDPYWFERFFFNVDDFRAELIISIWSQDRLASVFLGRLRIPVATILSAEKQTLPSAWYALQKRSIKSKTPVTGEVRVYFSFSGPNPSLPCHLSDGDSSSSSVTSTPDHSRHGLVHSVNTENQGDGTSNASSAVFFYGFLAWLSSKLGWPLPSALLAWLSSQVSWLFHKHETDTITSIEESPRDFSMDDQGSISPSFFNDDGTCIPCSQEEMPPPLRGGVLLSRTYMISAKALNGLLFGPRSQFLKDLTDMQRNTNMNEGPWTRREHELPKRVVTYVKAATKLVSSVKATEEQVYSRADDKGFVVNVSAITPDVPYGSTFKVNVQYCIFAGSSTSSGEKTSLLRISWGIEFLSNTMMKNFIEKGARQGLQENYKQYAELLERYARPQQGLSMAEDQAQNLEASLQPVVDGVVVPTSRSNWILAKDYFCNPRVCATIFLVGIVLVHIHSLKSDTKSKFEVWRIDLPDTLTELIITALLGAQIHSIIRFARTLLDTRHA